MAMRNPRAGFTLLEVLLVLALIVMLTAIAIPSLETWYSDGKLTAGADHLRARFAEARSHAIEDNRAYRFAVMPGQGEYRLAPDDPEFWGDAPAAGAENTTDDSGPPLVVEDRIPSGIRFSLGQGVSTSSANSAGWVPILTFLPTGSCDADVAIRLELEGCRPLEISVRALTGAVTVRRMPLGEIR